MKKGLIFILGIVVGVVLTLGAVILIGIKSNDTPYGDSGISLLSEPGDEMSL